MIEDYSFGKIVIDGKTYTDDVILLGKKVISEWWRKYGHELVVQDLEKIIEYEPEVLIIGTGSSGRLTIPSKVSRKLDFELESYPTKKAYRRYNELIESDKKTAAGLHLTC
ncbi:MAG: Mth938-like domain-containing protein [Candidatus Aenigmatarchaeota archaeon]